MPQPSALTMSCSSLLLEHLVQRGLLGVEHLAAQRQDGLGAPLASLLGRAAGGVALDDEQLAFPRIGGRSSRRACRGGSAGARPRSCAAPPATPRARPRGPAPPGRSGRRWLRRRSGCRAATSPARGGPPSSTVRHISGLLSRSLVWPWNCGSMHVDGEQRHHALADVLGGERDALGREAVRLDVVAHRLHDAAAKACSCVPPLGVGMPLT